MKLCALYKIRAVPVTATNLLCVSTSFDPCFWSLFEFRVPYECVSFIAASLSFLITTIILLLILFKVVVNFFSQHLQCNLNTSYLLLLQLLFNFWFHWQLLLLLFSSKLSFGSYFPSSVSFTTHTLLLSTVIYSRPLVVACERSPLFHFPTCVRVYVYILVVSLSSFSLWVSLSLSVAIPLHDCLLIRKDWQASYNWARLPSPVFLLPAITSTTTTSTPENNEYILQKVHPSTDSSCRKVSLNLNQQNQQQKGNRKLR